MLFKIVNERSLVLFLPPPISLEKQEFIWSLKDELKRLAQVKEAVVGMNSLFIYAKKLSFKDFLSLQEACQKLALEVKPKKIQARLIDIEVDYSGPDLKELANAKQMSVKKLVSLHTAPIYDVYFLGFLPGFVYLAGLDPILATPRLATPRLAVDAGSVGIGGDITGIYPFKSPGGWHILGKSSNLLFDIDKDPPALFKAGDKLRFKAINIKDD